MLFINFFMIFSLIRNSISAWINGDFENDPFYDGTTYKTVCPSGWICKFANPVLVRNDDTTYGGGPAPSGSYYLALQGVDEIDQLINFPIDSVSFYARSRPNQSGKNPILNSFICDTSLISTAVPSSWTMYTLPLSKYSGNECYLGFSQSNQDGSTLEIDCIVLKTPTDAPTSVPTSSMPSSSFPSSSIPTFLATLPTSPHVIATESKGYYYGNPTYSNFYLDNILDTSTSGQHNGFNIVKFVQEGPKLVAVALG
jgi:hypothetical protein